MEYTGEYFAFKACELLGIDPDKFAHYPEAKQAKYVAYAMIRHCEEQEAKAEIIEATIGGKIHG